MALSYIAKRIHGWTLHCLALLLSLDEFMNLRLRVWILHELSFFILVFGAYSAPYHMRSNASLCRAGVWHSIIARAFAYLQQWKDGNFLRIFCPLSLMGKCTLLDPNLCYTSLWRSMHVMLVLLPFDERCYLVGKDCRDANSMEKLQIQADILCMTCWRNHWLL